MIPKASFFNVSCSTCFPYLRPINFGIQQCKPLHTGGARVTNHWILHYVLSGTGVFQTRGKTYHPTAGDLFVIRPEELAFYAADTEEPWHYAWFSFECAEPMPSALAEDVITDPRPREVFLSTYRAVKQYPAEQQDTLIYGKLFELMALLRKCCDDGTKATGDSLVQQAALYMQEQFHLPITIEDVARHVHMEYSHLVTLFRKAIGITPWRYLTNLRMAKAVSYLMSTDYGVARIAELVGYKDATSFTRSFRRQYGMSPTHYVETYRRYAQRVNEP